MTTTPIRLFSSAPGQPKLPGYFPSSVQSALFGKIDSYGMDPRAGGTTPTEIALAVATTIAPTLFERYAKLIVADHSDKAASAKQKELVVSLFNRLKAVAAGEIDDAALNEAFKAKFEAWRTTDEGKRLAKSVRQFTEAAEAAEIEQIDDPILAGLMGAASQSRSAARSAGRQQAAQSRATLRQVQEAVKGSNTKLAGDLRSILASELGDD